MKKQWFLFCLIALLVACQREEMVVNTDDVDTAVLPQPQPQRPQTEPIPPPTSQPQSTIILTRLSLDESPTPLTPTTTPTSPSSLTATATPPTPENMPVDILSLMVSPITANPGETVTITWSAQGEEAILCPSTNLYQLFTPEDCQQLPLSGSTTLTIPSETHVSHSPIYLTLTVTDRQSASTERIVMVDIKCHTAWFFAERWDVSGCPQEALVSQAATQQFERGMMIWIEETGHYLILENQLHFGDDWRKALHHIYDPLTILQDTSASITPPAGLYAPQSGFGLVWRGDISNASSFLEQLGWATAPEFGYETIYQCTHGYPSGGRVWRDCYLKTAENEVIFLHPLGGWYLLSEREPSRTLQNS